MVLFSLFLCLLPCISALPGRCAHEEHQKFPVPSQPITRLTPSSHFQSFIARSPWAPIRIKVYYGPVSLPPSINTKFLEAMNGAINWFQRTLYVRPIVNRWNIRGMQKCGQDRLQGRILTESFEADFVLYVIADMEYNGIAGYATWCLEETKTMQPLLGLLYFGGEAHEFSTSEQYLATIIHEITHSLVFSPDLYSYFIKPNGDFYPPEELLIIDHVRGYDLEKIVLPTVTAKARKSFNCSEINGVELESQGGSGTVGAHWEKRMMYNDFMVADSDVHEVIYSDITLALFEDSGWYKVNYRYTNPMTWGYQAGCEFISQKCIVDSKPISKEFCVNDTRDACDYLGIYVGSCNIDYHYSPIPPEFRYFSDIYLGGTDGYLDFCPIVKPSPLGNCRDLETDNLFLDGGEHIGPKSRCLEWIDPNAGRQTAGCYPVDCSNPIAGAQIAIGNMTFPCPVEGGNISVPGYAGMIACPPITQLCRELPCVNNCHGYGYCKKGTCVCEDGSDSCTYGFQGGSAKPRLF